MEPIQKSQGRNLIDPTGITFLPMDQSLWPREWDIIMALTWVMCQSPRARESFQIKEGKFFWREDKKYLSLCP